MLSNVYQLGPTIDEIYSFISQRQETINIVIICKGKIDMYVVKKIMTISKINTDIKIGMINAGGIDKAYELVPSIAVLANIARKLKAIGVLIDAEDSTIDERVNSLLDSLRSHGVKIDPLLQAEGQTYKVTITTIEATHRRAIDLVIAVSGDFGLPFQNHKLEDHGVRLLLAEGAINEEQVKVTKDAKKIISRERLLELLENSHIDNIKYAFRHIYTMLEMLGVLSARS